MSKTLLKSRNLLWKNTIPSVWITLEINSFCGCCWSYFSATMLQYQTEVWTKNSQSFRCFYNRHTIVWRDFSSMSRTLEPPTFLKLTSSICYTITYAELPRSLIKAASCNGATQWLGKWRLESRGRASLHWHLALTRNQEGSSLQVWFHSTESS